jgi:hypothetical protein
LYGVITVEKKIFPYQSIRYWVKGLNPPQKRDPVQEYLKKVEDKGLPLKGDHLTTLAEIEGERSGKAGRWRPAHGLTERTRQQAENRDEIPEEEISLLLSVPYLQGYKPAPLQKDVTIYEKDRAYPGYNFYSSGHAQQAFLMDMEGKVLHEWRFDLVRIAPKLAQYEGGQYWRRVHLFPNGDVLAIYEGIGLIKLDKDSNLLWSFLGNAHHSMFVDADGSIYVLTRRPRIIPRINKRVPLLEDFITILDSEGRVMRNISLLQCFANSKYAPVIDTLDPSGYNNVFHSNTVQVFDGSLSERSPLFKQGNALVSLRHLNLIAILDLERQSVLWAMSDMWLKQHEPILLKNGNILIFDNLGNLGKSRVLEFEPFSQEIRWAYAGEPEKELVSFAMGAIQRLPNGNTLITESDSGRALEVTPEGKTVWEFVNPHRAGEKNELIATLLEVQRFGFDAPFGWLHSDQDVGAPPGQAQ